MSILPDDSGLDVERGTLASTVYLRIRNDILEGVLRPGEKLRTQHLSRRYEVGNSPVREALNRLSSDGLVEREDQRGFRVSKVSKADLMELVNTRCWLEAVALRQSIANGDTAWEEALVLAFHRFSRVKRSQSDAKYIANPEWDRVHRIFHMTLLSACGSRYLMTFCEHLFDQSDRYRRLGVVAAYPHRDQVPEHRAIMTAAMDRDADKAAELLTAHYNRTAKFIFDSDYTFPE